MTNRNQIDRLNLAIMMLGALGGLALFERRTAGAFAAGALLMTVDFFVLRRIGERVTASIEGSGSAKGPTVLLIGKFFAFLGVAAGLLLYFRLDGLAFGLGAMAIIFTTLASYLAHAFPRPAEG